MRKCIFIFVGAALALLMTSFSSYAQNTINGTIRDAVSRDFLSDIHISVDENTESGTFTNSNGKFSLNIAEFPVMLSFTAIGYHRKDLVL